MELFDKVENLTRSWELVKNEVVEKEAIIAQLQEKLRGALKESAQTKESLRSSIAEVQEKELHIVKLQQQLAGAVEAILRSKQRLAEQSASLKIELNLVRVEARRCTRSQRLIGTALGVVAGIVISISVSRR